MEKKMEHRLLAKYPKIAEANSPKSNLVSNCIKAFVVGGFICVIGQGFAELFLHFGYSKEDTAAYVAAIMVFGGAFLTGIGIYDKIGKFAGAGSIVPITGFANSIVAPAMEFKSEGYVLGVGAKLFAIAGPVLVYGISISVLVGLVHFLKRL